MGAGHAFKFAALIGTILTELVCDRTSTHPIDAFALDRPTLTHAAPEDIPHLTHDRGGRDRGYRRPQRRFFPTQAAPG